MTWVDPNSVEIDIVAAPSHAKDDIESAVRQLLRGDRTELGHGATYTGRPATWLFKDEQRVLKVRAEYRFGARDARRWIERAQALEREIGVHHPAKTWLTINMNELSLIANVTPRMEPLHKPPENCTLEERYRQLKCMLEMYLSVAARFERRLDEGLSNYALADDGTLYYVDDDIYSWDGFFSLCQALGFWFRALTWLDREQAKRLGSAFGSLLREHFGDKHLSVVIAGMVRELHMANAAQRARQTEFLRGLHPMRGPKASGKLLRGAPLALLADIHANYPALQAVLREMMELGVERALVLGDTVGYGPHPSECIQAVREREFTVLKGNHDYAVASGYFKKGFSTHAVQVARWTRGRLSADELEWLDELPVTVQENGWLAVHGAPQDKTYFYGYVYRMTYESNLDNLVSRGVGICFHGHSHVTSVYYRTKHGLVGQSTEDEQLLSDYSQCLVNPGSVGQPRDGAGSVARFGIFRPDEQRVSFHRVSYDIEATITDMSENGFSHVLIERLRLGA
ncbi:MAG: metallophosphoesterase family protein [Gammaproteobacteria bacterium]|nr:metallophosphoesterase family protein [Gammaproteobacteria bacterium]NIR82769.1 metallophosphoesterase family protein [Gammaproteobacteria bacterium]NIR89633.1 metallophosphoesterase family protein [Gammaproteobacteria bacterium]NIU03929.1 metallophosphoesterase family protein [Gammaproteobacteria bacterium]NIV51245.1 hypothetical protein [Gammaproteobacteria bacterium]